MIIPESAARKISIHLDLPGTGDEYDWAIEMADPGRIEEFWSFYVTQQQILSAQEQQALLQLILCSYEEYLYEDEVSVLAAWFEIEEELISKKAFFEEIIEYWSLPAEDDKDCWFNLTPLLRAIKVA
jgi:hypothetical protein